MVRTSIVHVAPTMSGEASPWKAAWAYGRRGPNRTDTVIFYHTPIKFRCRTEKERIVGQLETLPQSVPFIVGVAPYPPSQHRSRA